MLNHEFGWSKLGTFTDALKLDFVGEKRSLCLISVILLKVRW